MWSAIAPSIGIPVITTARAVIVNGSKSGNAAAPEQSDDPRPTVAELVRRVLTALAIFAIVYVLIVVALTLGPA